MNINWALFLAVILAMVYVFLMTRPKPPYDDSDDDFPPGTRY